MELNELRAKAVAAYQEGNFSKAADLYAQYCEADPHNLHARLRMGDAWKKSGNRAKAIEAYRSAAEEYAREGLLPRAIAASKLVLELDPQHAAMQLLLAELYSRRGQEKRQPAKKKEATEVPDEAHGQAYLTRFNELALPDAEQASLAATATLEEFTELEVDLSLELPPELQMVSDVAAAPTSLLQALERVAASSLASAAKNGNASKQQSAEPKPMDPMLLKLREKLPKIPLFSDLDPAPFVELIERCRLRTFNRGEQVFKQGSTGDSFFVICSGSVRVLREDAAGRRELALLHEGSFFGEMAILSDAPRIATVESASEDTLLLEISGLLLNDLSARYPQLALALKRFCRQRLLANVMSSSDLFRPFTKLERKRLIELFRAREVPSGATLLREGELSDGLYVVLSGEVEVRRGNELLARLREGELFGEMSLLTKAPAIATVTAARRTSLLRLPKEDFNTVMMTHPQVLELVANLADQRRRAAEQLEKAQSVEGETLLV